LLQCHFEKNLHLNQPLVSLSQIRDRERLEGQESRNPSTPYSIRLRNKCHGKKRLGFPGAPGLNACAFPPVTARLPENKRTLFQTLILAAACQHASSASVRSILNLFSAENGGVVAFMHLTSTRQFLKKKQRSDT
jgi:hypothetical protein